MWTYTEAAPEPLDDSLFGDAMPPSLAEDLVLVLDQSSVFPLDQHLLSLLAAKEGDFFCEVGKPYGGDQTVLRRGVSGTPT